MCYNAYLNLETMRSLALAILTAATLEGCEQQPEKFESLAPPLVEQRIEVKEQVKAQGVFAEVQPDPTLDRRNIPVILSQLIGKFGRIVDVPQDYDPNLPNLYLVATKHVDPKKPAPTRYQGQVNAVEIFHVLRKLGVGQQFLEGVHEGMELEHDRDYNGLIGEWPKKAMPSYASTGELNRAYIAIEGIYGDQVQSWGTEDMELADQIMKSMGTADQNLFLPARADILFELAQAVGILIQEADKSKLSHPENQDYLAKLIREKTTQMKPEEVEALIRDHVDSNKDYEIFLKIVSDFHYWKIQGRNAGYEKVIREKMVEGAPDAAFVVGAKHVRHLSKQLRGMNIFILASNDVPDSMINISYQSFTHEDYRKGLKDYDLHAFGLSEKQRDSFLNEAE